MAYLIPPKRRIEVQISISADDYPALVRDLQRLTDEARKESFPTSSIMGGYSSGWVVTSQIDKEQTHESWANELEEYLETLRDIEKRESGET